MTKFCAGCGQPNVAGSKFCPHCGSAIARPASAVSGVATPVVSSKAVLVPNLTPGSLINLAGRLGLGLFGLWALGLLGIILLSAICILMMPALWPYL